MTIEIFAILVSALLSIWAIIVQIISSKTKKKAFLTFFSLILGIVLVLTAVKYDFKTEKNIMSQKEQLEMAHMYYLTNDLLKSFEFYSSDKLETNAIALNNLGYLFANGKGVNQDIAKAKDLFNKAASLGNTEAMNNLVVITMKYPTSFNEVITVIDKACVQENIIGLQVIARYYDFISYDDFTLNVAKDTYKRYSSLSYQEKKDVFSAYVTVSKIYNIDYLTVPIGCEFVREVEVDRPLKKRIYTSIKNLDGTVNLNIMDEMTDETVKIRMYEVDGFLWVSDFVLTYISP